MEYRNLGRTGVKVSPLCLGAMNFPEPSGEKESFEIIDRALVGGINFIDTANVYNAGESEKIVGKALKRKKRRDEVVLATKVYGKMGDGPNDQGVSAVYIYYQVIRIALDGETKDYVVMNPASSGAVSSDGRPYPGHHAVTADDPNPRPEPDPGPAPEPDPGTAPEPGPGRMPEPGEQPTF